MGVGILAALAATRVFGSLLYEVSASDTDTMVIASVVLLLVTVVACYVPARRALRVDPVVALKSE